MTDLLAVYDRDLRTEAEVRGAVDIARLGPLWLAVFPGQRGFITYRSLVGVDPGDADLGRLIAEAVAHFESVGGIRELEWKTRAHDVAPGLDEALVRHGFVAGEPESVMIGDARALATRVPLPDGVTLRRITAEGDVRRMAAMQDEVFGSAHGADDLLARMAADPTIECWVAEAGDEIVSAGRLQPVPGTVFAGIWGGATREQWRHRGIYRALTAARAESALRGGATLIHSDSTEYSRPILERYGFTKVTETTPYERSW